MGLRYPLGTPSNDGGDEIDAILFAQQAAVRRARDPKLPPDSMPADPWIVPENLWKQAQAQEIANRARSMAIRHDSADIRHNYNIAAEQERRLDLMKPRIPTSPVPEAPGGLAKRMEERRAEEALLRIRRNNPGVAAPHFPPDVLPDDRQQERNPAMRAIGEVAGLVGKSFDGKAFVKNLTLNVVAGVEHHLLNEHVTMEAARRDADHRFEALYNDLPRPAQIFIEEMSPANAALVLGGGIGARFLIGSGHRSARVLGRLIEPMSSGPSAFARETAAASLGRIGYEATDGAPLPVRLAVGGAGIFLGAAPEAVVNGIVRGVKSEYLRGVGRALNETGPLLPGEITPAARVDMGMTPVGPPKGRPRGKGRVEIPDVLPAPKAGPELSAVVSRDAMFGTRVTLVDSALERAADLAGQLSKTEATYVPSAAARHLDMARKTMKFVGNNKVVNRLNGATNHKAFREAYTARASAAAEVGVRLFPSRQQFMDDIRQIFGSTRDLPDAMEYIGPAKRTIWGQSVPLGGKEIEAAAHPATGTIIDALHHPDYYSWGNIDQASVRQRFAQYDQRNSNANSEVRGYGVEVGDFGGVPTRPMSLRTHDFFIPTINRKDPAVRVIDRDARARGISGLMKERKFDSVFGRWADPLQEGKFEPELDLNVLFTSLDEAKAMSAGDAVFRMGVGGSIADRAGWVEVPALANGDTKIWLPEDEAAELKGMMNPDSSVLFDRLNMIKNTHLNGDISPITIQGSLAWFASPWDASQQLLGGAVRAAGAGDPFRSFRASTLGEAMAENPERWMNFASAMGFRVSAGMPDEFRTGLLERLPKVGGRIAAVNDGMLTFLLHGLEREFHNLSEMAIREGTDPDIARGAAADTVRMIVPLVHGHKLGQSATRMSVERGLATSISFIRQPAAFTMEALTGYIKLGLIRPAEAVAHVAGMGSVGQWSRLTPRERMAAQMFAKMQGAILGLSSFSALATAEDRGLTPAEALERALPGGRDFMNLFLGPELTVPIGGPYRSAIRAVAGQDMPFDGILDYALSKITTPIQGGIDLVRDRDFYDSQIRRGGAWEQLVRGLAYAATQVLPISVGTPAETALSGESFGHGLTATIGEFWGQNVTPPSTFERLERSRRKGAINVLGGDVHHKVFFGMTEEQIGAAGDARTLAQLRERIGTRAANAIAERGWSTSEEDRAAYVEELRRRANSGQRDAEALLISVDTQLALKAVAQHLTDDYGVLDRERYRTEERPKIIAQQIGQSDAFADVFSGFRHSQNEVDRRGAEWYELFEKATPTVMVDGQEVELPVDYGTFNDLEDEFFARMDPNMAALVQENIAVAPAGASETEVELREVRRELTDGGLWQKKDEAFAANKDTAIQLVLAEAAISEAVRENTDTTALERKLRAARSFAEMRQVVIAEKAQDRIAIFGQRPGVALAAAKGDADSSAALSTLSTMISIAVAEWAVANPEAAQRGMEWGYVSPSIINQIASGSLDNAAGGEKGEKEDEGTGISEPREGDSSLSEPRQGSGGISEPREGGGGLSQPREGSSGISEPRSSSLQHSNILRDFERGMSYGQLAVKYGSTPGAVEQRLRRALGGSPADHAGTAVGVGERDVSDPMSTPIPGLAARYEELTTRRGAISKAKSRGYGLMEPFVREGEGPDDIEAVFARMPDELATEARWWLRLADILARR